MPKWNVELSESDISYEVQKALKAQTLIDFIAKTTFEESNILFS